MKRQQQGVTPIRLSRRPQIALPINLAPDARVAQVSVLPDFAGARPFARDSWDQLNKFQPAVVIGYSFDLRKLVEKIERNEVNAFSPQRALFALTDCGTNPISEAVRDQLWRTFGVPLYELIVAPGCRLLASECEVHEGWHVQPGATAYVVRGELLYDAPPVTSLHTRFAGEIESSPCACGRPTPRLKNITPCLPRPQDQQLAAIA
jgi:phenylacetate-coenzyme A ligase PaaK-like adenylate-forming protein